MRSPSLTILLVDDDVLLCRSLSRSLKQKGILVHAVHCGADAISFVQSQPVSVMLLDRILPDRDGVTVIEDLRNLGSNVPIIMLTGRDSVQGKVRALNRGADDFLAKPVVLDELVARIHALVRRASGSVANPRAGRISLEAFRQEASVDGVRIELTPIEYSILALLIRNANQVVSRWRLVDAAWAGKSADVSGKALDLHLTRLRRKLGPAADQIETVRGAGFRLRSRESSDG